MTLPLVIIPVFNAGHLVRECLDSVARHSPEATVLVIDDASTEPGIDPMLREWACASEKRSVLRNDSNRGFVCSANQGMRSADGDVVLLNSDTLVTPHWLESLAECLDSDATIATATPWSNNGEIVSFPELCVARPVPDKPEALALSIRESGTPTYPELPTAVGFCMAISRGALDAVGFFDEQSFGRGYGEENDFSLRVAAAGFRNVLCDNAYVAHVGGGSFSPLGMAPGEQTMRRLLDMHPDYADLIDRFIAADPLSRRRNEIIDHLVAMAADGESPLEQQGYAQP